MMAEFSPEEREARKPPLMKWDEDQLTIPLPDDLIVLLIIVKQPGKEPASVPFIMSVDERDKMFKTPNEWREIWARIEQGVRHQLSRPEV